MPSGCVADEGIAVLEDTPWGQIFVVCAARPLSFFDHVERPANALPPGSI